MQESHNSIPYHHKNLFPHVYAAIQLRKYPVKGDTIQYIYTNSQHNNPLCRVVPIENLKTLPPYDREKYREMTLDAAETVLGFFGFDRTIYSNPKRNNDGRRRKWDGVKVNSCMSILRK